MKLLNEANLIYYSTCDSNTTKEGWLSKKGAVNKGFQKRWFVLKGNLLFYFEKPGERTPCGVIILEGYTVELPSSAGYDEYTFHIVFHGGVNARRYVLQAESQTVMDAWMKCITRASYDFMRAMVNELKSQLDELNAHELSEELKQCKTRDPRAIDPFADPVPPPPVHVAAAPVAPKLVRLNPFDTASAAKHAGSAPGISETFTSAGVADPFTSSSEQLDAFGQVPFTAAAAVSGGQQKELLKAPSRKKHKNSPKMSKKFSQKTAETKATSAQFYSVQRQPPRVRASSRFLELHDTYGTIIRSRIHSADVSLLCLDEA